MVEQRQSAMQRIQVGLIGLVVVVLFVSLATMVLERVTDAPALSEVSGTPNVNDNGTEQVGVPDEPLAELGVTPVAKEDPEVGSLEPTPPADMRQTPTGARR